LANLTTDDLISIRSLPAATSVNEGDVLPLGQLIGGSDEDRGGTINQLIALILSAIPPSNSGGGIAWAEYTASVTLVANTGAIINSPNDLEFTLPSTGLELGDRILIGGEGTGIWSVVSTTGITASNGSTNIALRRLLSHRFVVAELFWNGYRWIVIPAEMTGLELFDPNAGGVGGN
jgi:hypothetical protein